MSAETTVYNRPREILASHWNYIDVLLLALAYLPPNTTRLTANSGKWSSAIAEAKQQLHNQAPELLDRVHFTERPPLPPHSEQLDEFFFLVRVSGKMTTTGPGYAMFYISEATKQQILETRHQRLATYKQQILQITSRLQQLTLT